MALPHVETELRTNNHDPHSSLFLNTEVWANCTNVQANVYYCVQAVGAITTYPGYGSTTATATQTFVPTAFTSVPFTNLTENYTTTNPVIPLANGTRKDCYEYESIVTLCIL